MVSSLLHRDATTDSVPCTPATFKLFAPIAFRSVGVRLFDGSRRNVFKDVAQHPSHGCFGYFVISANDDCIRNSF